MVLGLRAPARRVPPLRARHTSTRGSGVERQEPGGQSATELRPRPGSAAAESRGPPPPLRAPRPSLFGPRERGWAALCRPHPRSHNATPLRAMVRWGETRSHAGAVPPRATQRGRGPRATGPRKPGLLDVRKSHPQAPLGPRGGPPAPPEACARPVPVGSSPVPGRRREERVCITSALMSSVLRPATLSEATPTQKRVSSPACGLLSRPRHDGFPRAGHLCGRRLTSRFGRPAADGGETCCLRFLYSLSFKKCVAPMMYYLETSSQEVFFPLFLMPFQTIFKIIHPTAHFSNRHIHCLF